MQPANFAMKASGEEEEEEEDKAPPSIYKGRPGVGQALFEYPDTRLQLIGAAQEAEADHGEDFSVLIEQLEGGMSVGQVAGFVSPRFRYTPLHLAAEWELPEVAAELLEARANIEAADRWGVTCLQRAAYWGSTSVVGLLLEAGADIEARCKEGTYAGFTPLHWASRWGYASAARALMEAGADVAAADEGGSTPLHWAARYGRVDVLEALLGAGAPLEAANVAGETALDWAAKSRYGSNVVEWLQEHQRQMQS
jgi:ankyrin repeat protein